MPSPPHNPVKNHKLPCRLSLLDWPTCYANECYLNYRCPAYRGLYPSPVRDYIPMPPVFILLGHYEAVPVSYQIPAADPDPEPDQ